MKRYIVLGGLTLLTLFVLLAVGTYWFVFGLDSWLFQRDLQRPVDQRLLFVGNSFTYQNNIDKMVAELTEAQAEGESSVFSTKVAFGGYRLFDHLDDIIDNEIESPIRQFLLDGSDQIKNWDLIVFQEQVELPGLDTYEKAKDTSLSAARMLGNFAQNTGAQIMLMETWGGAYDPSDPENVFPEFPIAQAQLALEYTDIADEMSKTGMPVIIAPAGDAFYIVYQDVLNEGGDPMQADSRFLLLYGEDRRHASLAGSYLAAAVITATYTQKSVSPADWIPLGLDSDFAQYLRDVADRAVFK